MFLRICSAAIALGLGPGGPSPPLAEPTHKRYLAEVSPSLGKPLPEAPALVQPVPRRLRRMLGSGIALSALGTFLSSQSSSALFALGTLLGLTLLALAIHWVGRAGPAG